MHKLLKLTVLGMVTAITLAGAPNANATGMLEMAESTVGVPLVAGETPEGRLTERDFVRDRHKGDIHRSQQISRRIRVRPPTFRRGLRWVCKNRDYRDSRLCRYSR